MAFAAANLTRAVLAGAVLAVGLPAVAGDFTLTSPQFAAGANTDSRLEINGITVTLVPEPSAALLGSLGMLALLRRRR